MIQRYWSHSTHNKLKIEALGGVEFHLIERTIPILDPLLTSIREANVKKLMQPLLEMVQYLIRFVCKNVHNVATPTSSLTYVCDRTVAQNTRSGDRGPLAIKLLEIRDFNMRSKVLAHIDDNAVDNMRINFCSWHLRVWCFSYTSVCHPQKLDT